MSERLELSMKTFTSHLFHWYLPALALSVLGEHSLSSMVAPESLLWSSFTHRTPMSMGNKARWRTSDQQRPTLTAPHGGLPLQVWLGTTPMWVVSDPDVSRWIYLFLTAIAFLHQLLLFRHMACVLHCCVESARLFLMTPG